MRGATPLDVAAASVMDNNELALALREPDLEKVSAYFELCFILLLSQSHYVIKHAQLFQIMFQFYSWNTHNDQSQHYFGSLRATKTALTCQDMNRCAAGSTCFKSHRSVSYLVMLYSMNAW